MKQFITKQWKQICSVLLILVMMVGIMPQGFGNVMAAEAQSTKLTFSDAVYRDSDVMLYFKVDEGVSVGTELWGRNNKLIIDGVTVTSSEWYYWADANTASAGKLAIILPYNIVQSGATTAAEIQANVHSVTIPKNDVIEGGLTVTEDVHLIMDASGTRVAQGGTISYSDTGQNDAAYRFWLNWDGFIISSWEYNVEVIFDGTVKKTIKICKAVIDEKDKLYLDVPCSAFEENASSIETVTGQHTLQIPKGTVMGDIVLQSDFNLEVSGWTVTKGPDVILQPSVYGASSGNAKEINLLMNQDEALSSDATNWTQKSFNKGGISFNGVSSQAVTFSKQGTGSKLFTAWFNNTSKDAGTIMTLDGDIQEGDYLVRFARTHFKYNGGSGADSWSNYTPTELSIEGIYQVIPRESQYLVYLKTSAEVPGNEGHPYPVTVNINGNTSTQWAQKVDDAEQDLWLLPIPKVALPETTDNVSITVKANKELFGTDGEGKCEIVNLKSDFTFYYRSNEFAVTELYWLGDANDDGAVDVKDIVRLKLYLNDSSSSVQIGKGADADNSGTVDKADCTKLYEYILKGEKVSM